MTFFTIIFFYTTVFFPKETNSFLKREKSPNIGYVFYADLSGKLVNIPKKTKFILFWLDFKKR